ncbi:MBOAT family O-acyltransferase [Insolitispirillum peregrinum]|uniref:MBOAT family O-acyltransferase n=1 Tax=Insolitispirillum peregrinum TaxID=80876 RepID=UPI00361AF832
MLFNSPLFILLFLPLALAGYWALARQTTARLWFLSAASVAFYGYWNWLDVPLLLVSVVANWGLSAIFGRLPATAIQRRRLLVLTAVCGNLAVLGAYKYLVFFASTLTTLTGWPETAPTAWALPLGISFFTFHHIIYWMDLKRGLAPVYPLRDYALYITSFPQILAGPLVRNREIVPQFALSPCRPGWQQRCMQGVTLFVIGLGKKVFLADALAALSNPLYAQAGKAALGTTEAWTAVLAFSLQIYFDFSGYSDMAIGLALMLGMVLPLNFDAPYRATSLQDFWRRWHMTLSRFLRDYLYIAFGGSRHGLWRQCAALIATMALGGLWHGAGWTFVLWGLAHGVALAAGALWRRWLPAVPALLGWPLTMLFVALSWVLFRAPDLTTASHILGSLWPTAALTPAPGGGRTLLLAALVAIIGPTSWQVVNRLRPRPLWAVIMAVVLVLALLKMRDGAYEFIYFQF